MDEFGSLNLDDLHYFTSETIDGRTLNIPYNLAKYFILMRLNATAYGKGMAPFEDKTSTYIFLRRFCGPLALSDNETIVNKNKVICRVNSKTNDSRPASWNDFAEFCNSHVDEIVAGLSEDFPKKGLIIAEKIEDCEYLTINFCGYKHDDTTGDENPTSQIHVPYELITRYSKKFRSVYGNRIVNIDAPCSQNVADLIVKMILDGGTTQIAGGISKLSPTEVMYFVSAMQTLGLRI